MLIISCDSHTCYQQIAMATEETPELLAERRLDHGSGEGAGGRRGFVSRKGGSFFCLRAFLSVLSVSLC